MGLKVRNQMLISAFFPKYKEAVGLDEGIAETERRFQELEYHLPEQRSAKKWGILTKRNVAGTFSRAAAIKKRPLLEVDWQPLLFAELGWLKDETAAVSVLDFGAVPDGVTDATGAFERAMGNGGRSVSIPEGEFLISGLRIPSNTELIGAGTDRTFLKMKEDAPKFRQGIRNRNLFRGNKRIRLEGFTLDWDADRFPKPERSASGGIASSGITLANVKFALVRDVRVLRPGLHGIDVTSAYYSYKGDGTTSRLRSRYVWIDRVETSGFGDDGITTHHSDFIYISHCYAHHPSGRAHADGFSNSNGIEVDDGSRHVVLHNNATEECFGGVEVKAHQTSSAAYDTQIIGHYSKADNRAYNFRHIGHHREGDEFSGTAIGIRATFLVALSPKPTPLYQKSEPRALVVSAYQKVSISYFAVSDDLHSQVLAVQYRASHVVIAHIFYLGKKPRIVLGKETEDVRVSEIKQWS